MAKKNEFVFSNERGGLLSSPYLDITKDKNALIRAHLAYMLMRSQEIFQWKNLPDTIPEMELELLLQRNGFAIVTKVNDKLYAFNGGLGGRQNEYYRPTVATVANPYLEFSANLDIGKECVVVMNDPFYLGLLPLFQINSEAQAETDISLRFAEVNSRIESFMVADSDKGKASAEKVLSDIEEGRKLGIIGDQVLFEGIKSIAYTGRPAGNLKDLMELKQYYKSQWFIDMGLNAVFNMKREAINESESQMGVDSLLPLIRQLLKRRKDGAKKINELYGTSIEVELSEIWKNAEKDADREDKPESEPDPDADKAPKENSDPESEDEKEE